MKKILIIILLILAVLVISYLLFSNRKSGESSNNSPVQDAPQPTSTPEQENVDYTASFEIYTNGTKRDFRAAMYHNRSQDVYIESSDPSIIQVKKSVITWEEFFNSLPMRLTTQCLITGTNEQLCSDDEKKLRFFLNDKENPDSLFQTINDTDKLVVTYGLAN